MNVFLAFLQCSVHSSDRRQRYRRKARGLNLEHQNSCESHAIRVRFAVVTYFCFEVIVWTLLTTCWAGGVLDRTVFTFTTCRRGYVWFRSLLFQGVEGALRFGRVPLALKPYLFRSRWGLGLWNFTFLLGRGALLFGITFLRGRGGLGFWNFTFFRGGGVLGLGTLRCCGLEPGPCTLELCVFAG